MGELVKGVFAAPLATLFIVSGILFLLIAVVGTITGKIDPGDKARMVAGVIGLSFIVLGLTMHIQPGKSEEWIDGGRNEKPCTKICEENGKACKEARRKSEDGQTEVSCDFWGVKGDPRWKNCLCG
jgi:hypothetical protein